MTSAHPPIGVLLMAYGGPESLDDLPGYLADIRSGRPTPRAVVEEIRTGTARREPSERPEALERQPAP